MNVCFLPRGSVKFDELVSERVVGEISAVPGQKTEGSIAFGDGSTVSFRGHDVCTTPTMVVGDAVKFDLVREIVKDDRTPR